MVSTTAPAANGAAIGQPNAGDAPVAGKDEIVGLAFDDGQIRRFADRLLHGGGVELAIGLGARTAHRRPLAPVQHAELDAALVGHPAHQAVERIDLADQMALAEPADRRIARHRADGREAVGQQRGVRAHARSRGRGLAAGVAATDHDDVEVGIHRRSRIRPAFSGSRGRPVKKHWRCFT